MSPAWYSRSGLVTGRRYRHVEGNRSRPAGPRPAPPRQAPASAPPCPRGGGVATQCGTRQDGPVAVCRPGGQPERETALVARLARLEVQAEVRLHSSCRRRAQLFRSWPDAPGQHARASTVSGRAPAGRRPWSLCAPRRRSAASGGRHGAIRPAAARSRRRQVRAATPHALISVDQVVPAVPGRWLTGPAGGSRRRCSPAAGSGGVR